MKKNGNGWEQILKHLYEDRPLTTFEASKICGVVHSTVSNWVGEGKLAAYKTPGGHRRIKKKDLLIFLKCYDIPVPEEILSSASSEVNTRKKILIVEDDSSISEILFETIKADFPECEIARAMDGFEAGKLLATFSPEIVIMDLILPGVDGFRVLANIRQDKSTALTKMIVITGYDSPETRERILQAGGVQGFLTKPVNLTSLKGLLEEMLFEKEAR